MRRFHPAWRVFGHSVHGAALFVTFVAALAAGILLHMEAPPLRRGIARRAEGLIASSLQGKILIDSVGGLGLRGLDGVNARVLDPSGKPAASIYGLRVRLPITEVVKSALSGKGPIDVHLTELSIKAMDVDIDVDEKGMIPLQRAIASREPSKPGGRGVSVRIDEIEVGHVWAHGVPASGIPVDADADQIRARVTATPPDGESEQSSARSTPDVALDVDALTLTTRGMPAHADAHGTLEAHVRLPAPGGGALGAKVAWKGTVAAIPSTLDASLDGEAVEAKLDAPEVAAEAVRAVWPQSPLEGPAAVHLDVNGTLPKLQVHAHLAHAKATFDLSGPVVVGGAQSADMHFETRGVDLHGLVPAAPPSDFGATGTLSVAAGAGGAVSGKLDVDFAGGRIAGAVVPRARIKGTFAKDAKGVHADASVSADEPGAPTALKVHLAPKGKSYEITFGSATHVAALDAVPRLGPVARGKTELKTDGVIDFEKNAIDVKLDAELTGLGHDVLSVEHATVNAKVRGTVSSPQIDLAVHGDVLDFGGYKFSSAELGIHGPARAAQIVGSLDADGDGTPDFGMQGHLSIGATTKIDDIQVHIARASENVNVHVGEITIAHGEMAVDPIEIDGLGGPITASFHSTFAAAHVVVKATEIDLARFARVSHVKEGIRGCIASVDVDTTLERDGGDGHVILELGKCSVDQVQGASFGLSAELHGRTIAGRVHAELEDVGQVVATTSAIKIGGKGTLPQSWKLAYGTVKFDGSLDIEKLARRLPRDSMTLDHIRGTVALSGRVERDSPTDDTPGLNLTATTSGLVVIGPSKRTTDVDGAPVISPPAWRMDGIDVGLDARIDGDSGFGSLALRLSDPKGPLVTVDLKSGKMPYDQIIAQPAITFVLLETVPFNAHVGIGPREAKQLPAMLVPKGLHGTLGASIDATGTMLDPVVDVHARVDQARWSKAMTYPVDLDLTTHYDGEHATVTLNGTDKDRRVIEVGANVDAKAGDLVHGITYGWAASVRAHLDALKLHSIPALGDRGVTGFISGDVALDGLHQDAKATLSLDVNALKVGDAACKGGTIRAKVDGKALDASMHLDQTDGWVDLTAHAATKWGAEMAPALDPAHAPTGTLRAKSFRAGLLMPFVDETFTELDGRIDANLTVSLDAKSGKASTAGTLGFSQGRMELAAMGGEFHDVAANMTFTPDGVVKVDGVKASAMSGRVEAAASARLDGLALASASAVMQIPSNSPLLMTFQGAQVGTVDGKMNIEIASRPKDMDVKVNIPTLHVELPLTSSREIQALGEMQGVRIGLEKKGGQFLAERLDSPKQAVAAPPGKTITTTIKLGSDVVVKKGTELSVNLGGSPVFAVSDAVRASGQVRLLGGKIDVQGKSFDIDSGAVTFQGDATDPQMVITASWSAPDGTKVYAELRGTLKAPKVTLRSEPAYSQNEIIALLVYGSADASNPNAQGNGTAQTNAAAGVAGGAATQPLNSALANMGLGGVSTRVDTSASTPRADVEVQIARSLSLQIAEVMGIPPPGTNPDTTLLTLSFRFAKSWAAQSTIGSAGTSIWDMVWQYRY